MGIWLLAVSSAWGQCGIELVSSNSSVCQGTTSASLYYSSTTNNPDSYSIDYHSTAEAQGFTDVSATLIPSSPITLTVPSNAAVGTYNAMLTIFSNTSQCVAYDYAITVTVNALPETSTSTTDVLCFGDSTGSIDLTVSGGTTPYTFAWSNSATTEDLNNIPAGTYSVTVSDNYGCSEQGTNIQVIQPAIPLSIDNQPQPQTDCYGNTVEFSVGVNGIVGIATYQWQSRPPNGSFTDISGATNAFLSIPDIGVLGLNIDGTEYRVLITDDCRTITSDPALLRINTITDITPVVVNSTICYGGNITYEVFTQGDVVGYQWYRYDGASWVPIPEGGPYSGTITPQFLISNGTTEHSGSYRVSVTFTTLNQPPSETTCIETSFTRDRNLLVRDPLAAPIISSSQEICYSSTPATLNATPATGGSGSYNYQWESSPDGTTWTPTGATGLSYSPSTLTSTTHYRITATDAGTPSCGSVTSLLIVITVYPLPAATISGTTEICRNAPSPNITFTGANGIAPYTFTYNIDGGSNATITTISGNTVTLPAPTGTAGSFTYNMVSVQDASPATCSRAQTGSATVTVTPDNTINLTSAAGTSVQNVCINTPISNITYVTTGATGVTFSGLPTGVIGSWAANTVTISGTPTTSTGSPFNYTVTLTGGCGTVNATGTIIVNPILPVSVAISASASTVCAGTTVTFTATPINGGIAPLYQWLVNGNPQGTNGSTFTYTPINGDVVRVRLTSNVTCPNPVPAISNVITITVNPVVVPSVTISASETVFCEGTTVVFTAATPTNGGLNPTYQWFVGAIPVGTNSNTYSTITLTNGQIVSVVLTSSEACASPQAVTSNLIQVTVNPNLPVSVAVAPSANPVCCRHICDIHSFTNQRRNNSCISMVFKWQSCWNKQFDLFLCPGNRRSGLCRPDFKCNSLSDRQSGNIQYGYNDRKSKFAGKCNSCSFCKSGLRWHICHLHRHTNQRRNNSCLSMVLKWSILSDTNSPTYSYVPATGDQVYVVLTSNATPCPTGNPATSNTVTMTVNPNLPVSVSVAPSANPVCAGTSVTFTATPTNGGTTPAYQWYLNRDLLEQTVQHILISR